MKTNDRALSALGSRPSATAESRAPRAESPARRAPRAAQVIVVGGGPAGASTAWHLASAGVDVLVVDRARFPRDKACAEYLSPEASRLLSAMGALAPVEAAGAAQLAGMRVRTPSGAFIVGDFAARHGFRGFRDRGLAVPRRVLDPILLDRARAAGARVVERLRVEDLACDGDGRVRGVIVRDDDGGARTLRADLVVGADGLRSLVARRLGVAGRTPWPGRVAFVAHYRGVGDVTEYGEMHVEHDGYVGLADVGGGLTNVALVVPSAQAGAARGDPGAFLDAWLRAHAQLAPRFAGAARADAVRVTGPFASRARRAWAPGAALVGDAADFFDPFTGEGIYSALRGGELLAPFALDALAAAGRSTAAVARTLRGYDRARRDAFAGKWMVERLIGMAVAWPPFLERAARVLERRRDMADLLVGVCGDFVPARQVLNVRYVARLLLAPAPRRPATAE